MLSTSLKLYAEHAILQSALQRAKHISTYKNNSKSNHKPNYNPNYNPNYKPNYKPTYNRITRITRIPKYPANSSLEVEVELVNKLIDRRIKEYHKNKSFKYRLVTISKYTSKYTSRFNILHYIATAITALLVIIIYQI